MNDDSEDLTLNDDNEDLILKQNLKILKEQIDFTSDRIKNGRIKEVKTDEIKIKYIRTLAYLCKTYANIREDQELKKIGEDIKILKKYLQLDD
jgi:outer membrane protein TolC